MDLILETFDNGMPLNWTLVSGTASVAGGMLTLNYECLQLPGQFTRAGGLVVEARARIKLAYAGDFNI
jgi:hypothetical protein